MLRAFARALIGCGYAIKQKQKKNSVPLLAHKVKLKEDLSRGNSIFAFRFFVFGYLNILFVCFCLKRLECFLFDLQVFKHRRY